jgi:hypothetical protein
MQPTLAPIQPGSKAAPSSGGERPGAVRQGWLGHLSILVALGFLFVPCARAFVSYMNDAGQPQKWNLANPISQVHTNVLDRNTRAVRFFLSANAYSTTNQSAELNAARACFAQWQSITNSILRFEEGGLMPGQLDVNTSDNTNVVFWAKTSTLVNGGLDNISGVTGVTFSDFFSDGTLAESDIVLNGVDFSWSTDFNATVTSSYFVEAVLLHEIGHFCGLAHSPMGGATMFTRGGPGVNTQAGLSQDEVNAVHALYPSNSIAATLGHLTGKVTQGTSGVFGAIVIAEDALGNTVSGTVTRSSGLYDMPGMPPGLYQVHVAPVDPANVGFPLFRGSDVSPDYAAANTSFAATTNFPITLQAGATATLNFAVSGPPVFRVARIRVPSSDPSAGAVVNYPLAIPSVPSDLWVGVYTPDTVSSNASLRITGDGLTFGPTTYQTNAFPGLNPPLNLLTVSFHVAAAITPGVRSLVVQQGTALAYANGFLEFLPPFPDYNFDGLDDRFQRQYFSPWTRPEAAPSADPDQDGYSNRDEFLYGTDPTDPASLPRVQSVRLDASGATVTWPSAPGKRYQVYSRPRVDSARGWQPVGDPVIASGSTARFLDPSATDPTRYYRVQAIP